MRERGRGRGRGKGKGGAWVEEAGKGEGDVGPFAPGSSGPMGAIYGVNGSIEAPKSEMNYVHAYGWYTRRAKRGSQSRV